MSVPNDPRFPRMAGMSHRSAELKAIEITREYARFRKRPDILSELQPFPVEDFYEFYLRERFNLNPGFGQLPFGMEGVTRPNGHLILSPEVYEGMYAGQGRARMTALHEGVHGIIHLPRLIAVECEIRAGKSQDLYRRDELPKYLDPEWQAARIASSLLMPWPLIRQAIERHGMRADEIAGVFEATPRAVEVRLDILRSKMHWL